MSTIKVDNIRIASESVSRPVTGVAAAWVSWSNEGEKPTINGSLNASSITYTRVGDVEANFTNVMADANFSVPTASSANSLTSVDGRTTDVFRARTLILDWANSTQQYADLPDMQAAVHGELA